MSLTRSSWARNRRRGSRLLPVLIAVALTAAACGEADSPVDLSDVAGCATESTAGSAEFSQVALSPAQVAIVDAGSGERRSLTVDPNRDQAQRVTLSTESTVNGLSDGQSEDQAEQATLPMAVQAACEGDADFELTIGEVSSSTPELDELIGEASGTRAGLSVRPGLVPISLRISPPEDAGSAARLAVEQSLVQALQRSVPLPTEPVGDGARWTVQRTIESSVTLTQTMQVELVGLDGDRVELEVSVEEEPVDDVFRIPGSDETLRIARYSMSGSGKLTVDLARAMPVRGDLTLSGARELVGADPAMPVIQQTGFTLTWQE